MSVAIIDYGSGNLRSVAKAFERMGGDVAVTDQPEAIKAASHIVLPGVGAFADCMRGLASLSGMLETLGEQVLQRKKPFLGICVGMQMLFETGHEHGVHKGLGWLKGEVVSLVASEVSLRGGEADAAIHVSACTIDGLPRYARNDENHSPLKIPHMGWNELHIARAHPLLNGIAEGAHAYFVHSYHAQRMQPQDVLATTDYGQAITAIVARDNIMGTQFHPEKSQETGLQLLKNFLSM